MHIAKDIEKVINRIAKAIENTPFAGKTYIVGGFVRDYMMNRPGKDLDIVVATVDGGVELANHLHKNKLSSKPVIYKRFGTAMTRIYSHNVEFVMTRKEVYSTNSRNPEVESGTLLDDAKRRDFTINTLLMDLASREIIDPLGLAKADIEAKVIRATSNPHLIFDEDPLRILRGLRFACKLNFKIEKNTYFEMKRSAPKLEIISWERRRDELAKTLKSDHPSQGILMMYDLNIIEKIIPELVAYEKHTGYKKQLEFINSLPARFRLRMAALLCETQTPEQCKIILNRLRVANSRANEIVALVRHYRLFEDYLADGSDLSDKKIRKLIILLGDRLTAIMDINEYRNQFFNPTYKSQIASLRPRVKRIIKSFKPFPLTGGDLMKKFHLKPGSQVGRFMRIARNIWLENPEMKKLDIIKEVGNRAKRTPQKRKTTA